MLDLDVRAMSRTVTLSHIFRLSVPWSRNNQRFKFLWSTRKMAQPAEHVIKGYPLNLKVLCKAIWSELKFIKINESCLNESKWVSRLRKMPSALKCGICFWATSNILRFFKSVSAPGETWDTLYVFHIPQPFPVKCRSIRYRSIGLMKITHTLSLSLSEIGRLSCQINGHRNAQFIPNTGKRSKDKLKSISNELAGNWFDQTFFIYFFIFYFF